MGSPERLIGLFVAELINEGKGGRWPTGWQSNRRQDGRSCLLHRRHGGATQREKNCDCEFQLRLPGRPAGIWYEKRKLAQKTGNAPPHVCDSRKAKVSAWGLRTTQKSEPQNFCNSLSPSDSHEHAVFLTKDSGGRLLKRGIRYTTALTIGLLGLLAPAARAQEKQEKNEVGLVIGATVTPSRNFSTGTTPSASFDGSLALGAEYDRRLVGDKHVALSAGADFLASPLDVKISNPPPDLSGEYAYIFLTPHVRVKFNPRGTFSPWVLLGGGYARFLEKKPVADPTFVRGTNSGTLVYGGGVDTRPLVRVFHIPIGFRTEVRDLYSGSPNYNQTVRGDLQHNVVFTGGFLIKF